MTRPRPTSPVLGALAVVTALVAGLLAIGVTSGAGPAAAAEDDETGEPDTPLTVHLRSMTPAQIPRAGVISISGVVTNVSEDSWSDINVAPFMSASPITARDDLALAAESDPDVAVGDRLTDAGTYMGLEDLSPGERASFTLRLPVSSLPISGAPGVYWIGVHALGTNLDGRDSVADGRARTFIPLVAPEVARRRSVPISVVLPVRERARRAVDGSLNGPARWAALTRPSGRLSRLVDFGASAGDAPLSWLVDPAVLDALEDFSRGNPPLSLGSDQRAEEPTDGETDADPSPSPEESPGESPEESPQESPEESPEESSGDDPSPGDVPPAVPGAPTQAQQDRAGEVLARLVAAAADDTVLALGYSDPDSVSLARRRPSLLGRAAELAARRAQAHELNASPVVAPPEGYFDPELLPQLDPGALVLLTDRARLEDPTLSRLPTGQDLVLVDERASSGGPAPTEPHDPLALRQRILSEAALEASKGEEAPRHLIVSLPAGWDPGPSWRQAAFFAALETRWSRLASVPRGATATYGGELAYSPAQRAEEIRRPNVAATRTLIRTSSVLEHLLANVNEVGDRLDGAALQASAYSARPSPRLAAGQVLALDTAVRDRMASVEVTGTDFVTLSGGSGSLTVTLVNGLEQPITVGLRARTEDRSVRVEEPDPVSMQPGERTTLRLQVTSGVGVHKVTLYPVTVDGEETGTPLTFSLRTSQVGRLIWYIIIAGGTLLAVMIARRIVLRVREHRWRRTETG